MRLAGHGDIAVPIDGRVGDRRPVARRCTWYFTDAKTRLLVGSVVALSTAAASIMYLSVGVTIWRGTPYTNDFFALWSWSKLVYHAANPVDIYDPAIVHAFQRGLDRSFSGAYPFAYPPSFLLLIWPLALLPRSAAYIAWVALTFAAYLLASWDRRLGRYMPVILATAPISVLVVVAGQNGFLTAALMIAGWRLIPRRPVVAGALLGLLSFKPQLGVLIPVALVAAGLWRPFAAAAAAVILSVLASAAAFGWAMWGAWLHALFRLSHFVAAKARLDHLMVTVSGNLRLIGAPPGLTHVAQVAAAIGVVLLVWRCFRRGFGPMPVAVLLVATFFATPYAFFYDLPIITNAVLLVMLDRHASGEGFSTREVVVLLAAIMLPFTMIATIAAIPINLIVLSALLALIGHSAVHQRTGPAPQHPLPSWRYVNVA